MLNEYFLYGDIGGTKTLLQMAQIETGNIRELLTKRYDSTAYVSFSDVLGDFLQQVGTDCPPQTACFAVAGPIVAQRVQLTNLSWQLDSNELSTQFSIPRVKLVNDFEAAALGIAALPAEDQEILQIGQPHAQATRVVLGAGTGMGVAWLVSDGMQDLAIATEAGHVDFAPRNLQEIDLWHVLQQQFGHVSVERVLSGPGLTQIYNFLQSRQKTLSGTPSPALKEDSGATITTLAQTHQHPLAIKSLRLFAEIYGAYAGNLALTGLCRGGVYLAGGIAPRIIPTLRSGGFMQAFCDKGRFSALMQEIPVHVITNPQIGLLGARREAQRLLTH